MDEAIRAAKDKNWARAENRINRVFSALPRDTARDPYMPYPEVLFNAALIYDNLPGLSLSAAGFYQAYLGAVPGAPNAKKIKDRVQVLENQYRQEMQARSDVVDELLIQGILRDKIYKNHSMLDGDVGVFMAMQVFLGDLQRVEAHLVNLFRTRGRELESALEGTGGSLMLQVTEPMERLAIDGHKKVIESVARSLIGETLATFSIYSGMVAHVTPLAQQAIDCKQPGKLWRSVWAAEENIWPFGEDVNFLQSELKEATSKGREQQLLREFVQKMDFGFLVWDQYVKTKNGCVKG